MIRLKDCSETFCPAGYGCYSDGHCKRVNKQIIKQKIILCYPKLFRLWETVNLFVTVEIAGR